MSAQPVVIRARGLAKSYSRHAQPAALMRDLLTGRATSARFDALAPIDFSVERGECFGVIGRNGSGKSTLLKLLCGVIEPTEGAVEITGSVLGLIELGAGFHPDFTGRENARINALVRGLSEGEIDARMPLIEGFADIGPYFDQPVRVYSSGMYARLGFAVSVHVDADILIVDEILAVGDAAFQQKCSTRMRAFRDAGGTVVLVSHSPSDITRLCSRALWLDGGKLRAIGPAEDVSRDYQRSMMGQYQPPAERRTAPPRDVPAQDEGQDGGQDWADRMVMLQGAFDPAALSHGHGGAVVTDAGFLTPDGQRPSVLKGGERVILTLRARAQRALQSPILGFIFRDSDGRNLFGDNTYLSSALSPLSVPAGAELEARFDLNLPFLPEGDYSLAPAIIEGTQEHHVHLHWMEHALKLRVIESPVLLGAVGVPLKPPIRTEM